ncbi:MAG: hypothetical protein AB7D38_12040 [Sulfurimonas sp.]|uniref:hypothetical protein n=1 Tax=Sulfurimonas sp. TaxID=2022749 RepID=UPI003D0A4D30
MILKEIHEEVMKALSERKKIVATVQGLLITNGQWEIIGISPTGIITKGGGCLDIYSISTLITIEEVKRTIYKKETTNVEPTIGIISTPM